MATISDIIDYIIVLRSESMKKDQIIEELQKQLGEKKDG